MNILFKGPLFDTIDAPPSSVKDYLLGKFTILLAWSQYIYSHHVVTVQCIVTDGNGVLLCTSSFYK